MRRHTLTKTNKKKVRMRSPHWFLSTSSRTRYLTGALAYCAQGIPLGLLHIALPAWLATQGQTPAQIGNFLGIILLPWAFKLLVGPLMDHFEYMPMGKHRPWLLGAQAGMVISLLALGWIDDPIAQFGLLTTICFFINAFTATQDVAIDGMAIDYTPVEEEGRLNAFMSFGKAAGAAVFSAIAGTLLVVVGMKITAFVCALGAAIVLAYLVSVRERHGEKVMPWTEGEASPKNDPPPSFREMYDDIRHSLWLRASVVIMIVMFIDGMVAGYGRAIMPIAAVQVFGLSTPEWADLNAIWGLAGALVALALGPLIDRFGAKAMMGLTVLLTGIHAFTLAFAQQMWTDSIFVLIMMALYIVLIPITMVCALALAMSICHAKESATQFAIYMSVSNVGATLGSVAYGQVAGFTGWPHQYALMGLLIFLSLVAILMFRTHGHPEEIRES